MTTRCKPWQRHLQRNCWGKRRDSSRGILANGSHRTWKCPCCITQTKESTSRPLSLPCKLLSSFFLPCNAICLVSMHVSALSRLHGSSWCRWSGCTDSHDENVNDYCSVVHQHTQGVLNYMMVGEKIWHLESHLQPGHIVELTQVRVIMYRMIIGSNVFSCT